MAQETVRWLNPTPCWGSTFLPNSLDLIESAIYYDHAYSEELKNATAPTHEELSGIDFTLDEILDDVDTEEGDQNNFLMHSLAKLLSKDSRFGYRIIAPRRDQRSELAFCSAIKTFALTTEANFNKRSRLIDFDVRILSQFEHHFLYRVLSICPHGLPIDVLTKICPISESIHVKVIDCGFDKYAYLDREIAARVRRDIPLTERRLIHEEIWRNWSPSGWGYLRRGFHAFASENFAILNSDAASIFVGLKHLSERAAYNCAVRIFRMKPENLIEKSSSLQIALPLLAKISGRKSSARRLYRISISSSPSALGRCRLLCDFSNMLALENEKDDKITSKMLAQRGLDVAKDLDEHNRFYYTVRLLNVLALLEYKHGQHEAALSFEQKAMVVVNNADGVSSETVQWATELVTLNMARIYSNKYSYFYLAEEMLELVVSNKDFSGNGDLIIELAKLKLRGRKFDEVISLILNLLRTKSRGGISPLRDVYCHLLAYTAYRGIGKKAEAHCHFEAARILLSEEQMRELERRFCM